MPENHQVKDIFLTIEFKKARNGLIALFSRAKAPKKKTESKDSSLKFLVIKPLLVEVPAIL